MGVVDKGVLRRSIKWSSAPTPLLRARGGAAVAVALLLGRQTTIRAESTPSEVTHCGGAIHAVHETCEIAELVMLKNLVSVLPVDVNFAPYIFRGLWHDFLLGVVKPVPAP